MLRSSEHVTNWASWWNLKVDFAVQLGLTLACELEFSVFGTYWAREDPGVGSTFLAPKQEMPGVTRKPRDSRQGVSYESSWAINGMSAWKHIPCMATVFKNYVRQLQNTSTLLLMGTPMQVIWGLTYPDGSSILIVDSKIWGVFFKHYLYLLGGPSFMPRRLLQRLSDHVLGKTKSICQMGVLDVPTFITQVLMDVKCVQRL